MARFIIIFQLVSVKVGNFETHTYLPLNKRFQLKNAIRIKYFNLKFSIFKIYFENFPFFLVLTVKPKCFLSFELYFTVFCLSYKTMRNIP